MLKDRSLELNLTESVVKVMKRWASTENNEGFSIPMARTKPEVAGVAAAHTILIELTEAALCQYDPTKNPMISPMIKRPSRNLLFLVRRTNRCLRPSPRDGSGLVNASWTCSILPFILVQSLFASVLTTPRSLYVQENSWFLNRPRELPCTYRYHPRVIPRGSILRLVTLVRIPPPNQVSLLCTRKM